MARRPPIPRVLSTPSLASRGPVARGITVANLRSSVVLLETVLQRGTDEPTHPGFNPLLKIAGGTLALVLGTVDGDLTQGTVLSFLLAIIMVQMAY